MFIKMAACVDNRKMATSCTRKVNTLRFYIMKFHLDLTATFIAAPWSVIVMACGGCVFVGQQQQQQQQQEEEEEEHDEGHS